MVPLGRMEMLAKKMGAWAELSPALLYRDHVRTDS
jgi:hypothetical protein